MTTASSTVSTFLDHIRRRAEAAGVFGVVAIEGERLECAALASAEPASYRVVFENGAWNVALVTEDRWLSESIEADLMHTGDPIEELIEEELVELGWSDGALVVKHYRSDDLLYTFRSPIPGADPADERAAARVATCLLAYEAAFRELGDMEDSGEE